MGLGLKSTKIIIDEFVLKGNDVMKGNRKSIKLAKSNIDKKYLPKGKLHEENHQAAFFKKNKKKRK